MAQPVILDGLIYAMPGNEAKWVLKFECGWLDAFMTLEDAVEAWHLNSGDDDLKPLYIMKVGKKEDMVAYGVIKTRKINRQQ